jgi:hypothetical protein
LTASNTANVPRFCVRLCSKSLVILSEGQKNQNITQRIGKYSSPTLQTLKTGKIRYQKWSRSPVLFEAQTMKIRCSYTGTNKSLRASNTANSYQLFLASDVSKLPNYSKLAVTWFLLPSFHLDYLCGKVFPELPALFVPRCMFSVAPPRMCAYFRSSLMPPSVPICACVRWTTGIGVCILRIMCCAPPQRASERERASETKKTKERRWERERERILMDENCRNVKTIDLSSTTQKVFIFLLALNGQK